MSNSKPGPGSDRLDSALRHLHKATAARPAPPTDPAAWQKFIETELDAMNRRLSTIETRMTLIFYLVVILTVTTIITDASAAGRLLQAVLQIK